MRRVMRLNNTHAPAKQCSVSSESAQPTPLSGTLPPFKFPANFLMIFKGPPRGNSSAAEEEGRDERVRMRICGGRDGGVGNDDDDDDDDDNDDDDQCC